MVDKISIAPYVSVVIPVCNDVRRLARCLHAMDLQTYPRDRFEVIVVDNASDRPIEGAVRAYPNVRTAVESKASSYAARNKGISLARGEVLAFTDADCIPSPAWLEEGVECLTSIPHCGMVGGRIIVFSENPMRPTVPELFDSIVSFDQRKAIERSHYAMTANLFTFKAVLDKVGWFNEDIKSGGDKDWGMRVGHMGYAQVYSPKACVNHPARNSFRKLYLQRIRITGGLHELDLDKYNGKISVTLWGRRLLMWRPPFRLMAQLLYGELKRKFGVVTRLKLAMFALVLHYARQLEFLRLMAGGRPKNV